MNNLLKLVRDLLFTCLIKIKKKGISSDKMNQIMKQLQSELGVALATGHEVITGKESIAIYGGKDRVDRRSRHDLKNRSTTLHENNIMAEPDSQRITRSRSATINAQNTQNTSDTLQNTLPPYTTNTQI